MKLFVDDIRMCPDGWIPARSVTEAIRILATQFVTEVSLDHDIACFYDQHMSAHHTSPETFEPVARYLALMFESEVVDRQDIKVRIHTANFEAGKKMARILDIEYNNYFYDEKDYKAV
jgi:hypothetical protein